MPRRLIVGKEIVFLKPVASYKLPGTKKRRPGSKSKHHFNRKQKHLNNLTVLSSRKKNTASRLTRNSKLFKAIVNAIQEKKGENIVSLDLRKIPEAVADFFVICEVSNTTQLKAIADHVDDEVKTHCGEKPYHHEGRQGLQWVLIDYVNIVVHVMMTEQRKFYQLEEMWSDAPMMEHND